MAKKRIGLGLFVLAMLFINIFLFIGNGGIITGSAVGTQQGSGNLYFIVLIAQVFLLAIILVMTNVIERREGSSEIKSLTDIDIFYIMLQKNKILKLYTVSKAFNIPKELALEWAKILEEHNMGKIIYHTFRDTEIVSMDYEDFIKKQKELQKLKKVGMAVPSTAAVVKKPQAVSSHKEKGYKGLAAFLSLFLGFLGIDRFYLGYVKTGILKLIIFLGIGGWIYADWFYLGRNYLDIYKIVAVSILSVWYLVDFFFILTGISKPRRKNGKK